MSKKKTGLEEATKRKEEELDPEEIAHLLTGGGCCEA